VLLAADAAPAPLLRPLPRPSQLLELLAADHIPGGAAMMMIAAPSKCGSCSRSNLQGRGRWLDARPRPVHVAHASSGPEQQQTERLSLQAACAKLDRLLVGVLAGGAACCCTVPVPRAPPHPTHPHPPQATITPEGEEQALALVDLLVQQGTLAGFGTGRQLPKRIYTIDELRLNKVEPSKLLSPKDESLNTVRNITQVGQRLRGRAAAAATACTEPGGGGSSSGRVAAPRADSLPAPPQAAALAGLLALGWLSHGDMGRVVGAAVGVAFALVVDQVASSGGAEALVVDTLGRLLLPSYAKRVGVPRLPCACTHLPQHP
jgi:hypothetical protein